MNGELKCLLSCYRTYLKIVIFLQRASTLSETKDSEIIDPNVKTTEHEQAIEKVTLFINSS